MKISRSLVFFLAFMQGSIFAILRDPFIRADGQHSFAYTAFGTIHGTGADFALITIDNSSFKVKQGDVAAGYTIVMLTEDEIILRDSHAKEIRIYRQKKPFNLDKLKG